MPKWNTPVRPTPTFTDGTTKNIDLAKDGQAKYEDPGDSERVDSPYPGDLSAGDGASRGYTPACKTSGYSVNVPQPDNTGPRVTAEGDGKNGMGG